MQQGRGGMGSRKHGRSGHANQVAAIRLWAQLDAERRPEPSRPEDQIFRSLPVVVLVCGASMSSQPACPLSRPNTDADRR